MALIVLKAAHDKLLKCVDAEVLVLGLILDDRRRLAVDILNLRIEDKDASCGLLHLPSGLAVVGLTSAAYKSLDSSKSSYAQHFGISDTGSCMIFWPDTDGYRVTQSFTEESSLSTSISHDSSVGWACSEGFEVVRCTCCISLNIVHDRGNPSSWPASVAYAIDEAAKNVRHKKTSLIAKSRTQQQRIISSTSSGTVSDLATTVSEPASLSLAMHAAPEASTSSVGPVYQYSPAPPGTSLATSSCILRLDVLAYVRGSMPISDLGGSSIKPALTKQLRAAQSLLVTNGRAMTVSAHHFLPPSRSHHVTCMYPQLKTTPADTELALAPLRLQLHRLLGLSEQRPALRVANALSFPSPDDASPQTSAAASKPTRLKDVHIGLPLPDAGARVSLACGSYHYYHYLQDKVRDSGWGCAYRSLQTIASWFGEQHYTQRPPPTHREIQSTLVEIGDKPSSFVGSSEWIGAIELGYVLDAYLGVSSRFITVNDSADIPSKARELALHFDTHGTPVMIGGGVLAYTLLGVAFNESTGDAAFLILDPHYTGGEDLRRIQQEGWIAWKRPGDTAAAGGPLFAPNTFYNFLCPQCPSSV